MKRIHLLICAITAFYLMFVITREAVALEPSPLSPLPDVMFATGGFGAGTQSDFSGASFYGGFTFSLRGDKIMTVRGVYMTEVNFLVGLGAARPLLSSWDLGVLYGIRTHNRGVFLGTASVGLAMVSQTRRGKYLYSESGWFADSYYEEKNSTTVGIPFELQAILTPTSETGLGLTVFADVNPKSSFCGATLSLYFGQLR